MKNLNLRAERGASTAEFAILLPSVILVLALLVNAAGIGIQQVRLQDAAGVAVRELARGEDPATVTSTVHRIAGSSATVSTGASGDWASVSVSAPPPGPVGWMNWWTLEAKATAPQQWVVAP